MDEYNINNNNFRYNNNDDDNNNDDGYLIGFDDEWPRAIGSGFRGGGGGGGGSWPVIAAPTCRPRRLRTFYSPPWDPFVECDPAISNADACNLVPEYNDFFSTLDFENVIRYPSADRGDRGSSVAATAAATDYMQSGVDFGRRTSYFLDRPTTTACVDVDASLFVQTNLDFRSNIDDGRVDGRFDGRRVDGRGVDGRVDGRCVDGRVDGVVDDGCLFFNGESAAFVQPKCDGGVFDASTANIDVWGLSLTMEDVDLTRNVEDLYLTRDDDDDDDDGGGGGGGDERPSRSGRRKRRVNDDRTVSKRQRRTTSPPSTPSSSDVAWDDLKVSDDLSLSLSCRVTI